MSKTVKSQSFFDKANQNAFNIRKITHPITQAQNIYLDQFFQQQILSPRRQSQQEGSIIKSIQSSESQQIQDTTILPVPSLPHKLRANKSIFHNFQKHLIVTLRHSIQMQTVLKSKQFLSPLAITLWNIFLNSKNYNIQVLICTFGSQQKSVQKNILKNQILNSIKNCSQEQLMIGQCQLRSFVKIELEKGKLQACFFKRKIKRLDLFKEYVVQFLEQLNNNGIIKRLSKCKKQKILKSRQLIFDQMI